MADNFYHHCLHCQGHPPSGHPLFDELTDEELVLLDAALTLLARILRREGGVAP